MKVFRSTSRRFDRALLVSALLLSTPVKGAMGVALVLHQHGIRRAHLHVLGYGDLVSAAASSTRFGHSPCPKPSLQSASMGVRILAVVTTGSVFVSTARGAGIDEAGLEFCQNCPLISIAEPQAPPGADSLAYLFSACSGRTASAVILLRNHTLLI